MRLPARLSLVPALAVACATAIAADDRSGRDTDDFRRIPAATPVRHLVVIFQENVSFDHYFGTYPNALNLPGETPFKPLPHTPLLNNLTTPLDVQHDFKPLEGVDLMKQNPNGIPDQSGCAQQQRGQWRQCIEPLPALALSGADVGSAAR